MSPGSSSRFSRLGADPEGEFDEHVSVLEACVARNASARRGAIINIASVQGLLGFPAIHIMLPARAASLA